MSKLRELLKELDIKPRKSRGQNFLLSEHDAVRLVDNCRVPKDSLILEIGPGLGAMTEILLNLGYRVIALEIESKFSEHLEKRFGHLGEQFRVLKSDFREINPANLANEKFFLVSNVPYSLSTELIQWLVNYRSSFSGAGLLLQREFSERLAAVPRTKEYGSLSVFIQSVAALHLGCILSGSAFFPKADVESRHIRIDFLNPPVLEINDRAFYEKLVRACFSMRRKKLVAGLKRALIVSSLQAGEEALQELGLSTLSRAEELSLEDFVCLSNYLHSKP